MFWLLTKRKNTCNLHFTFDFSHLTPLTDTGRGLFATMWPKGGETHVLKISEEQMVEPDCGGHFVRNGRICYLYRKGISRFLFVVFHGVAVHDGLRVLQVFRAPGEFVR